MLLLAFNVAAAMKKGVNGETRMFALCGIMSSAADIVMELLRDEVNNEREH